MFGVGLLKSIVPSIGNVIARTFKSDNRIRIMRGINQPPQIFRPGEEDITRYNSDEEARIWKEQQSLFNLEARGFVKKRKRRSPIDYRPQMRGVVLKTLIKKPKKPNSANRKCVLVRLSNGREATCYVPGIGHNLQEHSTVLVKLHRTPDVPGLRLRVIRGVYDCSLVVKRPQT